MMFIKINLYYKVFIILIFLLKFFMEFDNNKNELSILKFRLYKNNLKLYIKSI